MVFEFEASPSFDFLTGFAETFHVPLDGDRLTIPASMGEGTIRKIELDTGFKLLIHRYRLKEEFILKRKGPADINDLVTIILHSNEEPICLLAEEKDRVQISRTSDSAIQIASADLNSVTHFPAEAEIYFTVIGIKASILATLLGIEHPNNLVQTITSGTASFLFYESMNQEVQKVLKQVTDYNEEGNLRMLYYRFKVQELLYILFNNLLQREATPLKPVNKADIDTLFVIRTTILTDLSKPPHLPEISKMAGMSETKMKELFKQVFGDTLYNYYQKARMEEAAYLLRQGGYSVSEAGYQLGFSNLSHFSRLFEKHYGMKPKKFSSVG
ncbi:helix-turn-helix transcriptional regulator [Chitinophaga sp. MM2321]|uniref:helix-turn-helix transcriptional regulator n=1 Tax=Chitinophaga sp. MM2321 TaxID=3137178 RepID=UPI0032D5832D